LSRVRSRLDSYPHLLVAALCAGGLASSPGRWAPWIALGIAPAIGVALHRAGLRRALAVAAGLGLAAGVAVGMARVHAIDSTAQQVKAGDRVEGEAVVLERPRPSRFGSSAVIRTPTGARVLARAPSRIRWPAGGEPGTIVAVAGTARAPTRSATSDFDWPAYLRRHGIRAELSVDALRPTGRRRGGASGAVDAMRRRAERAVAAGLPADKAALARGMVLGQDEAIHDDVRDEFRASGLAHLLAVSGQNVMLLAALALPLLVAAGAGPRQRALALLVLIALYVPLAGAGPSLQRAGAMGAAGAIALAAGRVSSRWYALLLAALVTLVINPRAAEDAGWQLSFAAVVGILVLGRPLREALAGLVPRPVAEAVAITVAATVVTAPLLAHHFGSVSVAGLVANLVALPVVAPIMWLGMSAAALAQLPALAPPLAGPVDALAGWLGAVDGVLLGYLEWVARVFAEAPGATLALPLRSPFAVVAAYAAIAALAVLAARSARRAEPRVTSSLAAWQRAPAGVRLAGVAAGAGAVLLALVAWTGTPSAPRDLTVSFLDIGQGDSTLVQSPDGAAVLFDGGPPEGHVTTLLKRAGVRRLSLVVMTHQSRDHHAGLQAVVERFPVGTLLENGDGTRDGSFWRVVDTARKRGSRVIEPQPGERLTIGALTIRVYGPPPRPPGSPPPDDPNPRAIPAVVSYGSFDLFLSGDAESDGLAQYPDLPDVEAMKVSHHGSNDPGLPQLLRRLRPQIAAIEVGQGNSYGHPTPATLAALHAQVPHVYRTDRDGTVKLTVRDGGMSVETAR
jgi:competence protein ComEC